MPTFDFHCLACGTVFEHSRSFTDRKDPPCPSCGKKTVEKRIGAPAVVFKGAGWYKTDSRLAPAKPPAEPAKPATPAPPAPATPKASEPKSPPPKPKSGV